MGIVARTCEGILNWVADRIAVVIIGGLLLSSLGIGWLIYASWAESRSPVIQLQKTEWECAGTKSEATVVYVQSGKVLVPITTYHDVCVLYRKF